MDNALALLTLASCALSAALLWCAAELGGAAVSRPPALGRLVLAAATLLAATALWWPAHALHAHEAAPSLLDACAAAVTALALAALALGVGALWQSGQRPGAAAAALAMPVVAHLQAMISAPGLFRLTQVPGWLAAGVLTLGLSAALVAVQLPFVRRRHARTARLGAVAVAAALVGLGSIASAVQADAVDTAPGAEWLVVAMLLGLGATLLAVLRHAGTAGSDPSGRAAAVDSLTGLPTRLFFEGRLRREAKRCDAKGTRLAVLFIDLDGFKPINDTFGHSSGDRVLEQVGRRLAAIARGSGVAARVGGDEFLMLATGEASPDALAQLARQVIETLSKPYRIDDRKVVISCSIGIAPYPESCRPNKLIARADAAMYAAKRAGGARHCFYAAEMDTDVQQNFDTVRDLRAALARDELELYFQPKVDAGSGKVTAAEALLRWNHPKRGLVMPAEFIPLAERSGLIGPIGNWVIEAACKQARSWRENGLRMRVAINLSAHQMRQDDIADRIADALTRHRIHPSLLTCEITESAAMEDTGATQETFRRLGELGTHLSIDDFGTGYSSLSYLRRLPAEELKIDASFVKDVDHSADARAIVDAVVKLAHALGLKVVAEGVESKRQRTVLVELGCDELQGYLFARPMRARALLRWAMDDRSESAVFRDSLFGETRVASRHGALEPLEEQFG